MSARLIAPRAALAAVASGLLATGCADREPLAPGSLTPAVQPSADIVVGPGLPCAKCPNPNKGKIVFVRNAVTNGVLNQEVFKADANGANPVRLTFTVAEESEPAWSADYTTIVFVRQTAGIRDLYTIKFDGSGERHITNTPTLEESQPTWTPDNGLVFVVDNKASTTYKGFPQLGRISTDVIAAAPNDALGYGVWYPHLANQPLFDPCLRTGPCYPLSYPSPVQFPHVAPNGRDLAFVIYNPKAGRMGIRVIDLQGKNAPRWLYGTEAVIPSPEGPAMPAHLRFSPDGRQLAFLLGDDVKLVSAKDGKLEQTIQGGASMTSLAWSPDGTALQARGKFGDLVRLNRLTGAVATIPMSETTFYPNWAR